MKKYKMTGCARFFIFLIIFLPLLYLGVSYYNGEDGIQNVKDFLGIENNEGQREDDSSDVADLREQMDAKDKTIRDLNEQIENLREQLKEKEEEIERLQQ